MTSEQYWTRRLAQLAARYPGRAIVKVDRMPPPRRREPNTVYIRPASRGRWGKSVMIRVS